VHKTWEGRHGYHITEAAVWVRPDQGTGGPEGPCVVHVPQRPAESSIPLIIKKSF
jgi:hypothetical protein